MTKDNLIPIINKTLETWSNEVEDCAIKDDILKKLQNVVANVSQQQKAWEDSTPKEKCRWFVIKRDTDDSYYFDYECFKTKEKAKLYMKEFWEDEPILIKGKIVK